MKINFKKIFKQYLKTIEKYQWWFANTSQRSTFKSGKKLKSWIWGLDPIGCPWTLYMWSGDMVCAVWRCLLVEKLLVFARLYCSRKLYWFTRCLLVRGEYMDSQDVFLMKKKIWICKMPFCWRRIYRFAKCLLLGKEYMAMGICYINLYLIS